MGSYLISLVLILHLLTFNRPASVATLYKSGDSAKENGAPRGELDEASRAKAEARYWNFYEVYAEPDPEAQGTADFN